MTYYLLSDIDIDMGTKRDINVSTVIRQSFHESGMSMKQLSVKSDTPYQSVHGFITNKRDVTLSTIEAWCKVLRLRLVSDMRKKR